MFDILLEIFRAGIFGSVLFFFLFIRRSGQLHEVDGWNDIVAGFVLIFFGSIIGLTDNFESLNKFIIIGDTKYQTVLEEILGYLLGFLLLAAGFRKWLPKIIEHEKQVRNKLEKAVEEVETLQGILPICSHCKQIRDDKGYWQQVEKYIHDRSEAEFSHSICPNCAKKHYPDLDIYDN